MSVNTKSTSVADIARDGKSKADRKRRKKDSVFRVAAREAYFFEGVDPEASQPTLSVEAVVAIGKKCGDVVVGPDAVSIGLETLEQVLQRSGTVGTEDRRTIIEHEEHT